MPRRKVPNGSLRDRIVGFERVKASELVPNDSNWRTHPPAQRAALEEVLTKIGFAGAVLVRKQGDKLQIIDGHLRSDLAADQEVPVLVTDLTAKEALHLLTVYDPIAAMAEANKEKLAELLANADIASKELLGQLQRDAGKHLVQFMAGNDPELVPDPPKVPICKTGDLWLLGDHRLLCGDATNKGDVDRLLDGASLDYVFTSPPYGIDLDYEKGHSLDNLSDLVKGAIAQIDAHAAPDAYATMNYADVFRPGEAGFTLMSTHYAEPFAEAGWVLRGNRIWLKPFGRLSLSYGTSTTLNLCEWEYVQTWRKGRGKELLRAHGVTLRGVWKTFGEDSILADWREMDVTTAKSTHQAAFPVVLPVTGIRAYTDPGALVFDPFLGSGTTIIAAEMVGRRCYGLEIDPAYCDVVIERFETFTGKTATKA